MVSSTKFNLVTTEEFIKNFDFIGITQGNRPQFVPKGVEPIDEIEEE